MTFPATISITIALGDTLVLNRVNQDSFGSEYSFQDALRGANLKIRHSSDKPEKDGKVMKRHNVFFEYEVFATPTAFAKRYSYTSTMRAGATDDPALLATIAGGVGTWLASGTVTTDLTVGVN